MTPAQSDHCPDDEAYNPSEKFTLEVAHSLDGSEDGENSLSQGIRNEPEPNTQLGEDGDSVPAYTVDIADGDSLVDVDQVIDNFKRLAGGRLRGSTPRHYESIFRKFAEVMNVEQYSKRQIAGNKGRELLLQYLLDKNKVPEPSKRTQNAALKTVWEEGLGIPYPINAKRHLGELPEVQRRQSPMDSDVIPWIHAVEREEEPFLRTLILMIFQLGVRPSHACLFRWKHVSFGLDGKPEMIITTGREPGNKRMTPVKARLPEDLSNALMELRKTIPNSLPEDPILPYRKKNGQFDRTQDMNSDLFSVQWERFERKHILNRLRPVDIRHWVATTNRKAGLSLAARCALQGHKFKSSNQNENYDNPQDVELIEEQSRAIPYGPIGFVCPRMEVTQALPSELTDALSNCLTGEILPSQLSEIVNAYITRQNRQINKPVSNLVA